MRRTTAIRRSSATLALIALGVVSMTAGAGQVTRLTPPSELFSSGTPDPIVARFLPGQLFDLQATVQPDPGTTIVRFSFLVDDLGATRYDAAGLARMSTVTETGPASLCIDDAGKTTGKSGCVLVAGLPANTAILSLRFSKECRACTRSRSPPSRATAS
jgi:alkaline phosphatase